MLLQLANTTAAKYNVPLIAGSNFTLPFQVYSEYVHVHGIGASNGC